MEEKVVPVVEYVEHHRIDDADIQEVFHAPDVPNEHVTPEMREKISAFYGRRTENDETGVSADVEFILGKIAEMTEDEAVEILVKAIEYHDDDPNFPAATMQRIKLLVQGPKVGGLDTTDYEFDLKSFAAIIHYHSPYPEVRSVTDPFDSTTAPVETIRSYILGFFFMAGATVISMLYM